MSPRALALSLALATALEDAGPANDNSQPRAGAPTAPGLAIRGRDEHLLRGDAEHRRQAAEERDREVNARLDALERRHVDADALGELRLAPAAADPQFARSEAHFTT